MMNEEIKIKAAVVTVSDTRHETDDLSGTTLVGLLLESGIKVVEKIIVRDEFAEIRKTLLEMSAKPEIDLIFTCGGTGLAARDVTPEATLAVIEKQVPGLAEAMRMKTRNQTPTAILSRSVCGIRGRCLIINLPGSPKAVKECYEIIKPVLKHSVNLLTGNTRHSEN